MTILGKIIAHKKEEVANRKKLYPINLLEQSTYFETPVVSMKKYLLREDKSGIIAEFKRRSPSKGDINPYATVESVSIGYMQAGASGLSILTDEKFFGGKSEDLTIARKYNFCPILRKDFVIDEYQLIEARSIGADTVLLIAECLEKEQLKQLANTARSLGLEVLMEVHSIGQLSKLCEEVTIVGVNNRNLETFEVSIQTSLELAEAIPSGFTKISESGISDPKTIIKLQEAGYDGFLIGEAFMKTADPARACLNFIQELEVLKAKLQKINS
ncbi:MAG: indole-3-glycerol phosphate synthase [Saprospiraceae bacterium]|jgi:indole-3-glycerol phosphate synthase